MNVAVGRKPAPATRMARLAIVVGLGCSACTALFGQEVPGDTQRYDPVQAMPQLRAMLDGDHQLVRLSAKGVRPDGTIDLDDERVDGGVTYEFARSVEAPPDPPPVGAGGSVDGRWSQSMSVFVERSGLHLITRHPDTVYRRSRGMRIEVGEPEPGSVPARERAMACSFPELFRAASEEGAPTRDAVASIVYFAGTADTGAAYRFAIEGTPFSYLFDGDCRVVKDSECLALAVASFGVLDGCAPLTVPGQ